MAATETAIANLALMRMGQNLIDSIDGTSVLETKCSLVFDQARDELLIEGPENGWKFATKTYHGIDRDSSAITAIADYSGTVSGTILVTSASHGLVSGDMVTLYNTVYDGDYDATYVDANSFYVTATFTATDTGTAYWTSEKYGYRYAVPSGCKKVIRVLVGGVELQDWTREGDWIYTNNESSEIDIKYVQGITDVTKFPDHFVRVLVLKLAIELHYNLTQDLKAIQLLAFELEQAMYKAIAQNEKQKYVKEYSSSWTDIGHLTDTIE